MKHTDSRLQHMRYKMDSLNVVLMFCGRNDYVRCLCAVGWPHIRKVLKFFFQQCCFKRVLLIDYWLSCDSIGSPIGAGSEYKKWAEQFDVQSRQAEISQLLVNCPHVRSLHGQLVPAKVSYNDFWKRYFFKLSLLQQVRYHIALIFRGSLISRIS